MYSKESLIPGRFWEGTLNRGKGFSCRKGVVLEISLLRRKVDMIGETFSSSFVWDCRSVLISPTISLTVSTPTFHSTYANFLTSTSAYSRAIVSASISSSTSVNLLASVSVSASAFILDSKVKNVSTLTCASLLATLSFSVST